MKKKPEAGAEPDASEVRARALALLSRREHSARELKRKLVQRGFSSALVEPVLRALESENLLSSARYAEGWVRSRVSRGQGPRKIEAGLRQQALGDAEIEQALAGSGTDWGRLADEVRRKRFGSAPPATADERARQSRFLESRGFTHDQIRQVLSAAEEPG